MTTVVTIPVTLTLSGSGGAGLAQAGAIFREELLLACQDIGLQVSEAAKETIIGKGQGHGLWNTGALLNSITWSLIEAAGTQVGVIVGTNVEYAKYKEFGTIPHFVPFHLAKSLYDEAKGDWGWLPITKSASAKLNSATAPGVEAHANGIKTVTGRHRTYVLASTDRLWLKPGPDAKPVWGVVVSGKAEPFLYPAWTVCVAYCQQRLLRAAQAAANRIGAGG